MRRLRLRPAHSYPRHAHEAWSFALVSSGSVRLRSAGSSCLVSDGLATVLHPGEVHDGVIDEDTGLVYTTVSVPQEWVFRTFSSTRTPVFPSTLHAARPVQSLVTAASATIAEERRERLITAVTELFADARTGSGARRQSERSLGVAAKRMLDARFPEPLSMQAAAERMGVAPATLMSASVCQAAIASWPRWSRFMVR
ncbi:AraC family ligand binding domain-containing protein [Streptomyces sp. 3N207]|uniref:AraC family ligand binding domain-containing protein n=1 Tax=Streptomyces sp. 3N207 TaxID=3457417 RepID=UPI003FD370DC